jgi:hypothetical protein
LGAVGAAVPHRDRETRREQTARHAAAHDAETEKRD